MNGAEAGPTRLVECLCQPGVYIHASAGYHDDNYNVQHQPN